MKKIFLIPGFKQKTNDIMFLHLKTFLKKINFEVFPVPINWNYKTMTDYVSEFKEFYNKNKGNDDNYILGFSYGAVIALMTAEDLKPNKIYLCSLSPDFKEDLIDMKPWILKYIGKRRCEEIKKRSGIEIAKELNTPAVVFYGEKEAEKFPDIKKRCEETARYAKNTKLVIVKNAPHDISHPEYITALKKELYKITK
jgi:esterase/lipase